MEESILRKYVNSDSGTIKIMDEFESKDENHKKIYETLELNDLFLIRYNRKIYWVSLLLKRMPRDTKYIDSSLTFTDLKKRMLGNIFTLENKNDFKILNEIFEGMKTASKSDSDEIEYIFPVPVKFNAQNSSNRCGYGNKYYGEDLVYEGTLYGETTDYVFVGAIYRR